MIAHTDAVCSISLQSHSPFFCSGSADGSVRYWDIRNYKCLSDLPIHRKKYDEGTNVVLYHPH
jgi:striatin 1/3/4